MIKINSLWSLVKNSLLSSGKNISKDITALTYQDYYDRIKTIGLSLFEWENLPEGCNARFIEKTLYTYGYVLFFRDKNLGYMNARCTPKGLNYYDEAVTYSAYGTGYTRSVIPAKDSVLIRNNILERPTDDSVILFATRLTENQRTIDVNLNAQKTPLFISCSEQERTTILNIYEKYEGNAPVIIAGKKINMDLIKAIKTDAPYIVDKLDIHDIKLWNEIFTFFGVNNTNTQKRERLNTDEVNANNEAVSVNGQAMLMTREEACNQINEMYKLDKPVSVKMRDLSKMFSNDNGEEEENNGELLD